MLVSLISITFVILRRKTASGPQSCNDKIQGIFDNHIEVFLSENILLFCFFTFDNVVKYSYTAYL